MLDASILIATRNRARLLEATLEHLRALDAGGLSFEAIVVDNGSTDETPSVLRHFAGRLPLV
ncbi:MAG TPA: glycosyltransferase, partial [Planctomycetota bacterium]|nr:glycosyltransferase [Planctomycetota bacterium]